MANNNETASRVGNFTETNWFEQYFWPFGRTTSAEFGRGWLMVVIVQILLVLLGLFLLFLKITPFGMALVFSGLFIGTWMIGILHIRRLHDLGRSGWLAFFVYIPMVVAVVLMIPQKRPSKQKLNSFEVSQQVEQGNAKNDNSKLKSKRDARRALSQQAGKKRKGRRAMRGRGGNNKPPNIALMKTGASVAVFSFFAMLFSFLTLGIFHRMNGESASNRWG